MKLLRSISLFAVSAVFLFSPALAAASDTNVADETFRCELSAFVEGLRAVPSVAVAADASEQIAALTPTELGIMQAGLSEVPKWQELPAVMASMETAAAQHDQALIARLIERGGLLTPGGDQARMTDDEFRSDFLFLLDQMGRVGPLINEQFVDDVRRIRDRIANWPPEAIVALRQVYERRALELQDAFSPNLIVTGPLQQQLLGVPLKPVLHACDCDCGINVGCWVDCVGCVFNEIATLATQVANFVKSIGDFITTFFTETIPNLFAQIGQLASKAIQWFTDVFNQVSSFVTAKFNEIKNALPQNVNAILNFVLSKTGIDLNNINWAQIASSIPTISPPCPSGSTLDVIQVVCDSGANHLTGLLYEVAPDDGLSLVFKLGLAVIHFPLSYLCQCVDIRDALEFADAQAAHRTHTSTMLNERLGTRATQSSVNQLNASLIDLDADVAKAEAKLDALETTAAVIETNVNRIEATAKRTEATVNRIETKVNHTETTTNRTESKVDALTSGNNTQQNFLADFSTLMFRLNIETNLLENKPDTISWFQLPSAFGGRLESVSSIVADTIRMNLAASQNIFGAERELQRGEALRLVGDFVKAYEAFRSAYKEAVK